MAKAIPKTRWEIIKIEQLAANTRHALAMGPFGSRITKDNFVDSGVPVIRGTNISNRRFDHRNLVFITEKKADELAASNAYADDLVFTHRGTLGQVGIIPRGRYPRYVVSQSQMKLTCDRTKVLPMFLYYYFQSELGQHELLSHTSGSGVPAIASPLTTLRNSVIHLPPLPTQRKIAAILSTYDDLIENNTRRIAILEEMARSLYREWFVHFRFPGHEKNRMVNSELGMIPEGWQVVKLGKVVELAYGKALKADSRVPGDIPVYGSGGIVGYHNEGFVKGPGIIVGRKGNVGSVFWSDNDFFPIDTVFYVRSEVSLYYLYYNLREQNFINNDAAVPGLNRNQAYLLPFLLPSKMILTQFQELVSKLFKQTRILNQKNTNLRRTRDLLLPKLISGEVDVEELEIETGEGTSETVVANSGAERVEEAALAGELGTLWE